MIIAQYINDDDGILALVTQLHNGAYAVSVQDVETEITLASIRIYSDKTQAMVYAAMCA